MTFLHCLAIIVSAQMTHLAWQTKIKVKGLEKNVIPLNRMKSEHILLMLSLAMKYGLAIFFASLTLYLITN